MKNKTPIIITGFARSGTSFLALFFKNVGFKVKGSFNKNIDGGMEGIQSCHTFHLVKVKVKEVVSKETILDKIKSCQEEERVVKNPRFLDQHELGLETFKYWNLVYPNIRVILMKRDFENSIKSFNRIKNNKFTDIKSEVSKRKKTWDIFYNYLIEKSIKFTVLDFPDILKNYDSFYSQVKNVGIEFDEVKGREIWNKQVDFTKVHFS